MTNTTCLCTDQTFASLTQACVLEKCTVKDSLSKFMLLATVKACTNYHSLDASTEHGLWRPSQEPTDEV